MLASLGQGALVSPLDIESSFRLLPVHTPDFSLLGYKVQGSIFIDKCLLCTQECSQLMADFLEICSDLGVPLAKQKTIGPTTLLIYENLEIDTQNMTVKIPQEKRISLRSQMQSIAIQTKVTLKQLQELTSLLNFCVRAIPAGRAFLRRLYDASCGLKKPHHRRRVNNERKEYIYIYILGYFSFIGSMEHFIQTS